LKHENMASSVPESNFKAAHFIFHGGKPIRDLEEIPEGCHALYLSIDDTDSARLGMCTTFMATMIIEKLLASRIEVGLWDYPRLVRLNPQVPNKTRGNGALAIPLFLPAGKETGVFEIAKALLRQKSALEDPSTHPGLALMTGPDVPKQVKLFYERCLHDIVSKEEAIELASSEGIQTWGLKKGLGVIGALAALGADFSSDQTFELIAYRDPDDHTRARNVEESLVLRIDREVQGAFFNYDYENHKVCIAPSSPGPVLFGLRGETDRDVRRAYAILAEEGQPVATLFRSNQHTDSHIEEVPDLAHARPLSSVTARGVVSEAPRDIRGGHVIFKIRDEGGQIDCAAYEPTKGFRKVIRRLIPGDEVRVFGSVRPPGPGHGKTINLEKIQIISLLRTRKGKPRCPLCGATLTSMGREGGYKCRRRGCGFRDRKLTEPEVRIERNLEERFYEPPPVAWRHLYKPLRRLAP